MNRRSTKAGLRLRPTDGLREDFALSVPIAWMDLIRERAAKLEITVEEMLVQFLGHLADETAKVSRPPEAGDDPTRLVLRDSLRESYRRESDRTGLPIRTLLYRCVQWAADAFDGQQFEPMLEAVKLVPRRKAGAQ